MEYTALQLFLKELGPVWYMCLKIENCCLKIFVEIHVGEKNALKCVKCCLKIENCCLKSQTKHPLIFLKEEESNAILWYQYFKLILSF